LNQTKPLDEPIWATNPDPTLIATPIEAKQEVGWIVEKPPVQYMNWLFKYIWEWISYFQTLTDIGLQEYDAVVHSTSGTDETLQEAIDRVSAGAKILVLESQVVDDDPILVDKFVEIVLKPGVEIEKGTSTEGLSITASGVRIKGGSVSGFIGAGDKGIVIDVAATRVKLGEIDFSNNETDYEDPSGTAAVYGCCFS
jgi:hypothetical protein